ncbi:MAG TPA: L,D-transpeptidase family protein [Solirubrobacteraceae bacterium]|jgi:lipoprotein-anchoring transpeptidase ErfK/SrfK
MARLLLTAVAALAALALAAPAAGAQEPPPPAVTPAPTPPPPPPPPPPPEPRIAPGMTVAGVDVGNLTLAEATARLDPELGPKLRRPVVVAVAGHRYKLTQKKMKLVFDPAKSARRAFNKGQESPPAPGATEDVPPYVTFKRKGMKKFAKRINKKVYIAPRNATIRITLTRIFRRKSKEGRDLDQKKLRKAIEKVVVDPAAGRLLKPGRKALKAKINGADLRRQYYTIITIDRTNFRLRLFKSYRVSKSYGVAVGAAGYDTPTGLYSITSKQVNPTWSAPDKPWAGLYRGRTVPGGSSENPLKARWLGIANGVGIHGTGDPGSIGSRASHGCIRMTVPDVIDLYPRVPMGTPVLIQ